MSNQVVFAMSADSVEATTGRLAFWIAILMAAAAAIALTMGIATPAQSGPFCMAETCITYPYTDAARFVPRDYLWMYPALLMVLLFMMLTACIHQLAAPDKKAFSQIGLAFAIISTTSIAIDYVIQLAVLQPGLLVGEVEGLSPLSMYNPHGVFIALEDLGYLLLSVSFLFVAFVFDGQTWLERAIRWLFVAGFVLTVGALVVLVALYGTGLGYLFEVYAILITWLVLIIAGVLSAVGLRHARGAARTAASA